MPKSIVPPARGPLLCKKAKKNRTPSSLVTTFSIRAGFERQTNVLKRYGDESKGNSGGFYAGFGMNFSGAKGFGFSLGMYYSQNTKDDNGMKYTFRDMRIPLLLNYRYRFTNDISAYAFLGPTVTFGITSKNTVTFGGQDIDYDLYSEDIFTRFDIGAQFGLGVSYRNISLDLGLHYGLLNRWKNASTYDGDPSNHFNHFFTGLAYTF